MPGAFPAPRFTRRKVSDRFSQCISKLFPICVLRRNGSSLAGDHVVTGWRMIGTHKPAASLAYHHIRGARSINAPGHHDASSSPLRGMPEASPPLSNRFCPLRERRLSSTPRSRGRWSDSCCTRAWASGSLFPK